MSKIQIQIQYPKIHHHVGCGRVWCSSLIPEFQNYRETSFNWA